ncbi:hypothetical protein [Streptomyces anulatus]|uniref:hypothetical protein n=1 Tax=Streptomyces anulatus TaxID=1892 RepID=UPI00386E4E4D|nr:hypothetical protein OH737_07165 [Streptomyces anulatus]
MNIWAPSPASRCAARIAGAASIWRKRWCDYETAKARTAPTAAVPAPRRTEQPYATGSAIVVEHDAARLDPAVWGTETSMTAEAASLRTAPVQREENGMRVFFLEHDHTRTPRPVPSGMALPGLTRT